MSSEQDKKALLGQLRIDRDAPDGGVGHGRRAWMLGALVLLVALLGAGAWWAFGVRALPVLFQVAWQCAATARAPFLAPVSARQLPSLR